jgi:putative peptidoglycan lipid II flippase
VHAFAKLCHVSKSFKNISVVAVATMGSRVLGLMRDMLVTAIFGVGPLASAFYTAFTLPNLFRRLLGEGALTAALVPTLSDELESRERAGAFALVNQVASWLLLVCSALAATLIVALMLMPRFAGAAADWGAEPELIRRWLAAAALATVLIPYVVCVCLAAAFSAALQTLQRFLEPALSPIWLNLAMIGLLGGATYWGWASSDRAAMQWLCAGVLVGGFFQVAVPAGALVREGWRPRLDFGVSDPLRQIVRLMGPTLFGSAIYLINMAVSRLVGLSLNDSAVAVLNLATRLMELPIGVFAVAVSTVIFPLIAKHAAAGDLPSLTAAYRKGMRLILVINVPAAVGLSVLATPIVRLLFERGAFHAGDTAAIHPVLVVYAFGLPFFSFVNLVLRAFYAQKDTVTPVRAATLSFAVNLALSLALMKPLGTVGLALAGNVAIVAQAWYLQRQLTAKDHGFHFDHLVRDFGKVLGASAAMGAVVAAGAWAWSRALPPTKLWDATALLLLVGGGVATYGALLWWLKIEGREDLAAVVAKVRARFA